jgi:Flp pilus assembly protein TadG
MLEFALVIPIFVFVLYGLIAYGIALSAKQTITHSAAEGARAAVGAVPNPGETQDQAEVRVARDRVAKDVHGSLSGNDQYVDTSATAVGYCNAPLTTGPKCITVKVTYPYSAHPLVPQAPGLGLVMPDTLSSTAVVEVQP